jgi:hypothetical protein
MDEDADLTWEHGGTKRNLREGSTGHGCCAAVKPAAEADG